MGVRMGRVSVNLHLANNRDVQMAEGGALARDQIRRTHVEAVVDTGANYLVIPATVANQLGCPVKGEATIHYADRRSAKRTVVGEVWVELLGRDGSFKAIVEPDRTNALVGAIVLEDLDLLVDCGTQTLQPRDPQGIVAEIE